MKGRFLFYFTYLFIFLFCSCNYAYNERIVGRYSFVATDVREEMFLGYTYGQSSDGYDCIVGPTVFAVGFNTKYLIVKQHPYNKANYSISKEVVNYFIVPIYKEPTFYADSGVLGPLTLNEFTEKRKQLNIPDSISFTNVINELK